MRWCDLLFAHWTVDAAVLRRLIPEGLELDLFDDRAYVGAVPFRMERVTPRLVPAISLDAGQELAVRAARRFFHLPYFDAKFEIRNVAECVEYSAVRTHRGALGATFKASYRPVGMPYRSAAGSLDTWLTERYCLYSADSAGRVYRGEIDHETWPLQRANGQVRVNTLGEWLGIEMQGQPQTLHFAKSLDVHAWLVERI
jgi:uncharacterized protein YqjF (DUF2071 family)